MSASEFGIVLKVENLELCRAFYKSMLALGNPVIDSSFMCRFDIGNGAFLILEKTEWEYMPPKGSQKMFLVMASEDVAALSKRLKDYGYTCEASSYEKYGLEVCEFHDPEENSFLIVSKG